MDGLASFLKQANHPLKMVYSGIFKPAGPFYGWPFCLYHFFLTSVSKICVEHFKC